MWSGSEKCTSRPAFNKGGRGMYKWLVIFFTAFAVSSAQATETAETDWRSPSQIEGTEIVTADQAKKLFDEGVIFIDVRNDSDWDAGRVPGAVHLFVKRDLNEAAMLRVLGDKSEKVVIYCNGEKCKLSTDAARKAVHWGFKKVYWFRLGFPSWQTAGYPVE